MRWAINQITLAGGSRRAPERLADDLRAVRAGGWTAIELWLAHWDGYIDGHGLGAARRLLDDAGLAVAGGCGGSGFFFVRGAGRGEAFAQLERRLEQCRALGAPHLVVAPGFTEPAEPSLAAFELAAENLNAAGALAAGYGVRLGIECLAGARLVRSQSAAIALARRAGDPAVGVILDTYHLYAGVSKTEDLEALRATPDLLTFVHVSDVAGDKLQELWTVPDRELPLPEGRGGVPNARLLDAVRRIGYDGDLSLELFSAGFEADWRRDPVGASREAYRACRALTDGMGWTSA
ncbi:MAG TPA: sugar phosphate isomerase/epimerase family protein [Chloroflexota bacterium]|nr:sugar phosphate isomerase/epimerase family protein [Chloroflexota bacterium]